MGSRCLPRCQAAVQPDVPLRSALGSRGRSRAVRPSGGHEGTREHRPAPDTPDPETGRKEAMFKISSMTRVGLVAVACVAVAAPSALAKAPAKGNAKGLYGYAMSYAPTKRTPEPGKPAKVQSLALRVRDVLRADEAHSGAGQAREGAAPSTGTRCPRRRRRLGKRPSPREVQEPLRTPCPTRRRRRVHQGLDHAGRTIEPDAADLDLLVRVSRTRAPRPTRRRTSTGCGGSGTAPGTDRHRQRC